MNIALSLVLSYLLGSLPFAYLVSQRSGIDIRVLGDHNVGAFNVLRHVGLEAGLITLFLDISKGAVAIIVARALNAGELIVYLSGIMAVIGHNWPVFLRFKGGRGEATAIGVLFVIIPWMMLFTFIVGIIVLFLTRNSILVGMVLFIPLPVIGLISYWLLREPPLITVGYSVVLPCISGITHWLTTRNLSYEERKEAGAFWISKPDDRGN